MSRIRTIKPEAFDSLSLGRVPIQARWLFAGFWCLADDEGRFNDNPVLIRSKVFPVDDMPVEDIESWIDALIQQGCLCRYQAGGESFLHAPHFRRAGPHPGHQVINKPTPSQRPPCPTHTTPEARAPTRMPTRGPRPLTALPIAPAGEEPPRRCPTHQGTTHAPRCGACKEQRIAHERWVEADTAETLREEKQAMLVPCNGPRCTCDHTECDSGYFTVDQVDPSNGRVSEVQKKCRQCFPLAAASTPSERNVRSFVDARELGADYSDARAAAAGDR